MTLLGFVVVLAVWSTASLVLGLVLCKTIYWMGKPEAGTGPQARTPRPALPAPRGTDEQIGRDATPRRAPALSSAAPAPSGTSTRRPAL